MANQEHWALIQKGVAAWNGWRETYPSVIPDLSEVDLRAFNLDGIDFKYAILRKANFSSTRLVAIDFRGADLSYASFVGAHLIGADFRGACLDRSLFDGAYLSMTVIGQEDWQQPLYQKALLEGTNLSPSNYWEEMSER